jgi:hypothetical protein
MDGFEVKDSRLLRQTVYQDEARITVLDSSMVTCPQCGESVTLSRLHTRTDLTHLRSGVHWIRVA